MPGRSVAAWRVTSYWIGVSCAFHSSSGFTTLYAVADFHNLVQVIATNTTLSSNPSLQINKAALWLLKQIYALHANDSRRNKKTDGHPALRVC